MVSLGLHSAANVASGCTLSEIGNLQMLELLGPGHSDLLPS